MRHALREQAERQRICSVDVFLRGDQAVDLVQVERRRQRALHDHAVYLWIGGGALDRGDKAARALAQRHSVDADLDADLCADLEQAVRVIRTLGIAFADEAFAMRYDRGIAQRRRSIGDVVADALGDWAAFERSCGHMATVFALWRVRP